jgi:hypothetical protein
MYSYTLSLASALCGAGGQRQAPTAFLPGKTRYPLHRRLGRTPGPVWRGAKNLAPARVRSLYRTARSGSLYLLSYPDYCMLVDLYFIQLLYTSLVYLHTTLHH